MAEHGESSVCPKCRELERRIAALEAQLASANKNSGNSSKPPSSDIVKAAVVVRKKKDKQKRKIGGQPGHPKHERPAFSPDQIDKTRDYALDACPECGGKLEVLDEPASVVQQIEVLTQPTKITEHRSRTCFCGQCHKQFVVPIPREIRQAGLVGPRMTALIGYLKGACHCSFSTIHKFLRDVVGVTISRGQLRKVCGKVARSLDDAYAGLLALLPSQKQLNVDETGHTENAKRMWTWCFRAPLYTLFHIDPSRGSDVLLDVLGTEFKGVLGCDYFSAYRKYMRLNKNVLVQFCLAHLIRDVKFLVEHPHAKNQAYGQRVLVEIRKLFAIFHEREQYRTKRDFRNDLENQAWQVRTVATFRVPQTNEAQALADRFRNHGHEYMRFVTTPGIEPTNNLAEQAIRFVVIDRRITQGSRSPAGRKWLERIWTTAATCSQHGQSVFHFLHKSVRALFRDQPAPSLLFGTS